MRDGLPPPPLRANVEGIDVKPNLYVVKILVKIKVNVNQYVNQDSFRHRPGTGNGLCNHQLSDYFIALAWSVLTRAGTSLLLQHIGWAARLLPPHLPSVEGGGKPSLIGDGRQDPHEGPQHRLHCHLLPCQL